MFELKIYQDDEYCSPAEWDLFGEIYFWHRRYSLGDNLCFSSPEDFLDYHSDLTYEELEDMNFSQKEGEVRKNNLLLPLYLFDHSGLSLSTTPFYCPYDSAQVGYIMVSHKDIIKEFGELSTETLAKAEKILVSEVKSWDDYLSGNVYGFQLLENEEHIDSCWGFYGDIEEAKEQMKERIPEIHWDLLEKTEMSYLHYT